MTTLQCTVNAVGTCTHQGTRMKKLTNNECDLLIQQSGYTFHTAYTGDKNISANQSISLTQLRVAICHAFFSGQQHESRKRKYEND